MIPLSASRLLTGLLFGMYCIGAISLSVIPDRVGLLFLPFLLLWARLHIKTARLTMPGAIVGIEMSVGDRLSRYRLHRLSGVVCWATLARKPYRTPWFMFMCFRNIQTKALIPLVVGVDSVSGRDYSRLSFLSSSPITPQ